MCMTEYSGVSFTFEKQDNPDPRTVADLRYRNIRKAYG